MKKMMSMVEAIEALESGNAWEILMSISKVRARRVSNELGLDIPARVWRMKKGQAIAAMIEPMNAAASEDTIPAGATLKDAEFEFTYEGKTWTIIVSAWEKYGHRRLYISRPRAGRKDSFGWFDANTNTFSDESGKTSFGEALRPVFMAHLSEMWAA